MRSMVRPRRALALLSFGLLCSLAVPAVPAGASPSVEPASAPAPVRQAGSSCDETGNCNRTGIQLPFFYDDGLPWWDMSWERDWANDLQQGESNWVYFPTEPFEELLESFDTFCFGITAGLDTLDVPIIGDLAAWVADTACDLARPFVWVAQQVITPVVRVLAPLYTLIARTLDWTSRQIIGGGLGVFFTFVQTPLKWANDGLTFLGLTIGAIGSNLGEIVVYEEDLATFRDNYAVVSLASADSFSGLGDVISSLSFRDLEPGEGCVSVAGATLCPLGWLSAVSVASYPWSILFVLWIGFWTLFSTVVAVGAFARMTDS